MKRRSFLGLLVIAAATLTIGCAKPTVTYEAKVWRAKSVKPAPGFDENFRPLVPVHFDPRSERAPAIRQAHREACAQGVAESCDFYASMLRSGVGGPANQLEAQHVSERACRLGHEPSCRLAKAQQQRIMRRRLVEQDETES